jgi:hypothetical protein
MYSLRRFIFEHVLCLNWERNIIIQNKIYEVVKFGFLFSANAVMPGSLESEGEDEQENILRTLALVLRRKRHVEQPTFSPQSL